MLCIQILPATGDREYSMGAHTEEPSEREREIEGERLSKSEQKKGRAQEGATCLRLYSIIGRKACLNGLQRGLKFTWRQKS